ncbi:MAG: hypothetical protein OXG87_09450 [Gemmatimonadetes bacterium]|nr:hypothetical protein [Gemmatimonadota bacterium]
MKKHLLYFILLLLFGCRPQVDEQITICSFNIKFLGLYKKKDNEALAQLVGKYDMVIVQELVAPPDNGQYCGGESYSEDPEADAFFDAMTAQGFDYSLSCEDTGRGEKIHKAGSSTEWSAVFYKPDKLKIAPDLPNGFLAKDRSAHPVYPRVPHAHGFRTINGKMDFVVINVHLSPGGNKKKERKAELLSIAQWIDRHDAQEQDFYIVGDMNIENAAELKAVTPAGFVSLNDECRKTNTAAGSSKPYDHVMYRPARLDEIDEAFDFQVINLIDQMRGTWRGSETYPGDPYNGNLFAQHYSDHHPVLFRLNIPGKDDD